jgi:hypothetical protein
MRPILDADEMRSGLRVADALRRALGRDDDAALAAVLEPAALDRLGDRPGSGERIRAHMGISATLCTRVGAVSPVLLARGRLMWATYRLMWATYTHRSV